MRYTAEDYLREPCLRDRPSVIAQQIRSLTHVLASDENDALEIRIHGAAEAVWWPCGVPESCISKEITSPAYRHVAFHGIPYGEREQFLTHPDQRVF